MKNNNIKKVSFSLVEPCDNTVPEPIEKQVSGKDYMFFGEDNMYPDLLFTCYDKCTLLQTLINGTTDYVSGKGIENDFQVSMSGMKCSELVKKISLDYIIFGAFAIQVRRNKLGEVVALDYVDVSRCRLDESETHVYYCRKWNKYARDIRKYDRWQKSVKLSNSIFYFKNPKSRGIYGLPIWNAAIKDALTGIEITNFHFSSIRNNFAPSAIINFNNGVPTDEEQDEIENELNSKFSGTSNASRLLVSFNENKDVATTIERLTEDNFDKKYESLSKNVKDNLLAAFRASSQLFGINPENTSFNSIEFTNAFSLFKETVAAPIQEEIEDAFKLLGYDIKLNEFEITFVNSGQENTV